MLKGSLQAEQLTLPSNGLLIWDFPPYVYLRNGAERKHVGFNFRPGRGAPFEAHRESGWEAGGAFKSNKFRKFPKFWEDPDPQLQIPAALAKPLPKKDRVSLKLVCQGSRLAGVRGRAVDRPCHVGVRAIEPSWLGTTGSC